MPGGAPAAGAKVEVWLLVDDFTRVFRAELRSDARGEASALVPGECLRKGCGSRYVHVTAGERWPMAERILALD
jgi:hypothetical protein